MRVNPILAKGASSYSRSGPSSLPRTEDQSALPGPLKKLLHGAALAHLLARFRSQHVFSPAFTQYSLHHPVDWNAKVDLLQLHLQHVICVKTYK